MIFKLSLTFILSGFLVACSGSAGDLRVSADQGLGLVPGDGGDDSSFGDDNTDDGGDFYDDGSDDGGSDDGGSDDGGGTDISDGEFISMAWDGQNPDAEAWNGFAKTAVETEGQALLASGSQDIANYCPNYPNLNSAGRIQFWIALLAAMTKNESAFDPESFEVLSGPNGSIVKRGLLRIDIDRTDVHECNIVKAGDLHDPATNLRCSVRMLNYWVDTENFISRDVANGEWRGASRVWPSLQNPSTLGDIQGITQASDVCQ